MWLGLVGVVGVTNLNLDRWSDFWELRYDVEGNDAILFST